MTKNPFKNIPQEDLSILADIGDILTTWSANDASAFLQEGAVLLCVAKVDGRTEDGPFRFALGWPKSAGVPSQLWKTYDHAAGQR